MTTQSLPLESQANADTKQQEATGVIVHSPGHVYHNVTILDNASAVVGNVHDQSVQINLFQGYYKRDHDVCTNLIDSLLFDGMWQRHESIVAAYPGTCQWILGDQDARLQSSSSNFDCYDEIAKYDFSLWLEGSGNFYWICGTAGSGKSTLVSFITSHETHVRHKLALWARDSDLIVASFFFWRYGDFLQKSINGMLRALIVQILQQKPSLAELVSRSIPQLQPSLCRTYHTSKIQPWSNSTLKSLLLELLRHSTAKVCFFIDGLDEFHGYYGESQLEPHQAALHENTGGLLEIVKILRNSPGVKVCVASRPGNVFDLAFRTRPDLDLQNLNREDIKIYIHGKLSEILPPAISDAFVGPLISRSEGIFLWSKLAVDLLVNGVADGDGVDLLWDKIDKLPAGLEQMYRHMLQKLPPEYRSDLCMIITIHHHLSESPLRSLPNALLIFLSRAYNESSRAYISNPQPDETLTETYIRKVVLSRGCGLMELRRWSVTSLVKKDKVEGDESISRALELLLLLNLEYIHRTAADFFVSHASDFGLEILLDRYDEDDFGLESCTPKDITQCITDASIALLRQLMSSIDTPAPDSEAVISFYDDSRALKTYGVLHHVAVWIYSRLSNFWVQASFESFRDLSAQLDLIAELCPFLTTSTWSAEHRNFKEALQNRSAKHLPSLTHLAWCGYIGCGNYTMDRLLKPSSNSRLYTAELMYVLIFTIHSLRYGLRPNLLPWIKNLLDILRKTDYVPLYIREIWSLYLAMIVKLRVDVSPHLAQGEVFNMYDIARLCIHTHAPWVVEVACCDVELCSVAEELTTSTSNGKTPLVNVSSDDWQHVEVKLNGMEPNMMTSGHVESCPEQQLLFVVDIDEDDQILRINVCRKEGLKFELPTVQ